MQIVSDHKLEKLVKIERDLNSIISTNTMVSFKFLVFLKCKYVEFVKYFLKLVVFPKYINNKN